MAGIQRAAKAKPREELGWSSNTILTNEGTLTLNDWEDILL